MEEILKLSSLNSLDYTNSHGLYFVLFVYVFKGLDANVIYNLYVCTTAGLFSYFSVRMLIKSKVSHLGHLYFILFLLPLYSVQLRAGVAIVVAYHAINLRNLKLALFSLTNHYSIIALFIYKLKNWFLVFVAVFILVFVGRYYKFEKILIYSELYSMTEVKSLVSIFNYKVVIAAYAIIYSILFDSSNWSTRFMVLSGIILYYVFLFFPIFAHRLSEIFFFFIPLLFTSGTKFRRIRWYVDNITFLLIFVAGLRFLYFDTILWLVE